MSECTQSKYHCATCPIRHQAARKPNSVFARIHRWHSSWNRAWKAYEAHLKATTTSAE